ncbi:biotin--[acetyl-CoA-carboxylase] ligase [Rubritalea sp.]|uniref:biotin--[acetyl-CoA-carboxylase] ligase n=1 Tax=Rubritalea sp. TaxID=2109375 RepID=UPI003EF77340
MDSHFSLSQFRSLQKNWELHYFIETDSTNEQAKKLVLSNPPTEPCVFLAEQQLNGRGRRENTWTSAYGQDLLFTAVIETGLALSDAHKVATSSALAVAHALATYGLQPQVKFPNDIYLSNSKVAGILIEQLQSYTLIGIGINVNSIPSIDTATSLFTQLEKTISREELLAAILNQLIQKISLCQDHYQRIRAEIEPLDLFYDQRVQYIKDSQSFQGIGRGLSKNGYLLIDHGSGPEEVHTGHSFRLIP